jgi:hypothetical protein
MTGLLVYLSFALLVLLYALFNDEDEAFPWGPGWGWRRGWRRGRGCPYGRCPYGRCPYGRCRFLV